MRKLLLVGAFLAASVLFAALVKTIWPATAEAGPVYQGVLTSADAGCTQTMQLVANASYCVQATLGRSCFTLGPWDGGYGSLPDAGYAGLAIDITCAHAMLLGPPMTTRNEDCFDTVGNHTAIAACNVDGGVASVNVFRLLKNQVDPLGRPSSTGF